MNKQIVIVRRGKRDGSLVMRLEWAAINLWLELSSTEKSWNKKKKKNRHHGIFFQQRWYSSLMLVLIANTEKVMNANCPHSRDTYKSTINASL